MLDVADVVNVQLGARALSPAESGWSSEIVGRFTRDCLLRFSSHLLDVIHYELLLVKQHLRAILHLLVISKHILVLEMKRLALDGVHILSGLEVNIPVE